MEIAIIVAFIVVAAGPLIGIARAHAWAKAHGKMLRTLTPSRAASPVLRAKS